LDSYNRIENCAGPCEHGTEPSGSIKDGGFLDQLANVSSSWKTVFHGVSYFLRQWNSARCPTRF